MDRPVIVVLHHNANALHIRSDDIRMLEPDAFIEALKTHPDIRQVIAGHVHITSTATWRGLPFTTLAGGHYSVSFNVDQPEAPIRRIDGPGQMAVVIGTPDRTTVLFDDFIDGNATVGMIEGPRRSATDSATPRRVGELASRHGLWHDCA